MSDVKETPVPHVSTEPSRVAPMCLGARLVKAQRIAKAVAKDSTNAFHKYKYASAEGLIEEARGALSEAGLALITMTWDFQTVVRWIENPSDSNGFPIPAADGSLGQLSTDLEVPGCCGTMRVEYALYSEDGDVMPFEVTTPVILEKGRPIDKAQATALTYNLGYFLRGLLLLPREDAEASVDQRRDDGPARGYAKTPPQQTDRRPADAAKRADASQTALQTTQASVKAQAQAKAAADQQTILYTPGDIAKMHVEIGKLLNQLGYKGAEAHHAQLVMLADGQEFNMNGPLLVKMGKELRERANAQQLQQTTGAK